MGLTSIYEDGSVYFYGGFRGSAMGTLTRMDIPKDICSIFSEKECMKNNMGCVLCPGKTANDSKICFTAGKEKDRPTQLVEIIFFLSLYLCMCRLSFV